MILDILLFSFSIIKITLIVKKILYYSIETFAKKDVVC